MADNNSLIEISFARRPGNGRNTETERSPRDGTAASRPVPSRARNEAAVPVHMDVTLPYVRTA